MHAARGTREWARRGETPRPPRARAARGAVQNRAGHASEGRARGRTDARARAPGRTVPRAAQTATFARPLAGKLARSSLLLQAPNSLRKTPGRRDAADCSETQQQFESVARHLFRSCGGDAAVGRAAAPVESRRGFDNGSCTAEQPAAVQRDGSGGRRASASREKERARLAAKPVRSSQVAGCMSRRRHSLMQLAPRASVPQTANNESLLPNRSLPRSAARRIACSASGGVELIVRAGLVVVIWKTDRSGRCDTLAHRGWRGSLATPRRVWLRVAAYRFAAATRTPSRAAALLCSRPRPQPHGAAQNNATQLLRTGQCKCRAERVPARAFIIIRGSRARCCCCCR